MSQRWAAVPGAVVRAGLHQACPTIDHDPGNDQRRTEEDEEPGCPTGVLSLLGRRRSGATAGDPDPEDVTALALAPRSVLRGRAGPRTPEKNPSTRKKLPTTYSPVDTARSRPVPTRQAATSEPTSVTATTPPTISAIRRAACTSDSAYSAVVATAASGATGASMRMSIGQRSSG